MKKHSIVVLALASTAIMGLASCAPTTTSSTQTLPETAQAVADKIAATAAICEYSNGQTLKAGEANNNTVPTGKAIYVATKYTIQAWDGSKAVSVTADLAWVMSDKTVLKVGKKDDTHSAVNPMTPYFGQPDFSGTMTCTVTYQEHTATALYNVKVPALAAEPTAYKDLSKLKTAYDKGSIAVNTWVKAYGYVTGFNSDKSKVVIQSSTAGAIVYGSANLFTSVAIGDCLEVIGAISEYYLALELQYSISATKYTGTDVVAVKDNAIDEAGIKKSTDSGWTYAASRVSVSAVLSDVKGNFTVGASKMAVYYTYASADVKTAVSALFTTANVGKTFTVKGIGDSYKGLAEIIPTAASDVALA